MCVGVGYKSQAFGVSLEQNSCRGQTQQQQEEGPFSQVSGSTGNKQAGHWKT